MGKVQKTIMGSNNPPGTLSALSDSLFSYRLGISAALSHCNSARVAAQQANWSSVANYINTLHHNDSINWGQVVFLTTCVMTMAGCGLLSRLVWRRRSPKKTHSKRLTVRKTSTKSSKTLTSSDDDYEDEEYDSNGSLHHGTNPQITTTEWSSQPQEQSSDGKTNLVHPVTAIF